MKKNYRILDHTADISINVSGVEIKDLFIQSSLAMMDLICNIDKVRVVDSFDISVNGITYEQLLVNWLQELLYLHEVNKMLFCEFIIISINNNHAEGIVRGEKFDSSRHELFNDIKAVTHSNLDIKKHGNKFNADITFDI